jgi:hypothetical protein
MDTGFIELRPKYFLNENWEILKPIPSEPALKSATPEEELKKWIESTVIKVTEVADTKVISSDNQYNYLKSELGMNIILPKGRIEKMRFKITLKGDGYVSDKVVAIDGFPKDVIEEKYIIEGKIKVGITKLFKFIPVIGKLPEGLLEIELNPWEFKIGSLRKVNIDFSGGLTFFPEWFFKEDGIKNDLRVALTIRKSKEINRLEGDVVAAWIYDPGVTKKEIVQTDSKTVKIY